MRVAFLLGGLAILNSVVLLLVYFSVGEESVPTVEESVIGLDETNLKKQGMLALTFANKDDYDKIQEDDQIDITGLTDFAPGKQLTMVLHHADGTTDKVNIPSGAFRFNGSGKFLIPGLRDMHDHVLTPERDFPMYVRWFQEGKLPLDKLVSRRFKLEEINAACEALEQGQILGRAIVTF